MSSFVVCALPAGIADAVRRTRRSPEYGHPAVGEVATGTGPCRSCLDGFAVGEEERLLFTHRPFSGSGAVGAPGPVFIHAERCARFEGPGFPAGLRAFPLVVECRTRDGRVLGTAAVPGSDIDALLEQDLADPAVDFLFLRHAQAGCYIARVERAG